MSEETGVGTFFLVLEEGLFLEDFKGGEEVDSLFVLGVEVRGLKAEGVGI